MGEEPRRSRTIALAGPGGSGKTTLLESLCFVAGAIGRKGRVSEGNTVGDWSAEARDRQMSVEVNVAHLSHDGIDLTILDCPGSVEFVQETRAALLGVELVIVVVEPVAERMIAVAPLLHFLDQNSIPHMIVINKMDRSDVRYRDLLGALRSVSQRPVVPHHYAIGRGDTLTGYIDLVTEKAWAYKEGAPSQEIALPEDYREREAAARAEMLETLADFDDDLMEILIEEGRPSEEMIMRDLRKTLRTDQVVPVCMAVAEKEMGTRRLLEVIVREAPGPSEHMEDLGLDGEGGTLVQVLKTYYLPHTGKISLVRVWRGEIKDGMQLGGMRVGGVFRMMGGQLSPAGEAAAGEIVALGRLEGAVTGQLLSDRDGQPEALLPTLAPAQPMFAYAITAANRADEVKLSGAFQKLIDEDPSLRIENDPEMHQTLLWGQGEMHLKVAMQRLRTKYHIEVEASPPRTPYRETIRMRAEAHGRHKKQSGGHGQFGDVKIEIEPLDRGAGFSFTNKVVGGAVPRQFIPAVEAGARDHLKKGPLGFPVVDVGVTLNDGQFHSVDSNELSFKMATALALKDGLPRCRPVMLEPILDVAVSVPSDYTSRALQLVSQKRGQILGYEAKAGWTGWDQIKAHIPQGEMHHLIIELRSLSQGTGFFDWSFDHLQEVPDRLAEEITKEAAAAVA